MLEPSVFAEEGLPLIATVASGVFSKLLELEDTVIFFDEVDALMHTRTDTTGSFEQKFLTTSLLPNLQELTTDPLPVFVATNHSRPGSGRSTTRTIRLQAPDPAAFL